MLDGKGERDPKAHGIVCEEEPSRHVPHLRLARHVWIIQVDTSWEESLRRIQVLRALCFVLHDLAGGSGG